MDGVTAPSLSAPSSSDSGGGSTTPLVADGTPATTTTTAPTGAHAAEKVVVRLRATGSAPILRQALFRAVGTQQLKTVANFLRKELGCAPNEQLFLYVNSAFAPAPDDTIENLYRCFGINGVLIVNYAITAAWG